MRSLGSSGDATWKLRRRTALAVLPITILSTAAWAGTPKPLPTPFDFVSTECARHSGHRHLAFHLVWFDFGELLPSDEADVEREVRSIFCRLGVDVGWQIGGSGHILNDDARVPQIPVILRKRSPRRLEVMGQVPQDSSVRPVVWVYLDGVKAALGLDGSVRRGHASRQASRAIATAVGRVAAHEVIHALAPYQPHAAHGLMRSSLGRTALLGPQRRLWVGAQFLFAVQSALTIRDDPSVRRVQAQPVDTVMVATVPPI